MTGRYEARGSLELEATKGELQKLVHDIRTLSGSQTYDLFVSPSASADPYDGFLTQLRIERGHGQVLIYRQEGLLVISGAPGMLQLLADSLDFLVRQQTERSEMSGMEVSDHIHLEYYPEHFFLHPNSEPLTVLLGTDMMRSGGP